MIAPPPMRKPWWWCLPPPFPPPPPPPPPPLKSPGPLPPPPPPPPQHLKSPGPFLARVTALPSASRPACGPSGAAEAIPTAVAPSRPTTSNDFLNILASPLVRTTLQSPVMGSLSVSRGQVRFGSNALEKIDDLRGLPGWL